jgi:hypothetical protein
MTFEKLVEILANLATFIGVPIAIILFYFEKKKERRDREYGTYNALDDKYIEYVKLLIKYPDLDFYELEIDDINNLPPLRRIQSLAMFEILFSLFERAFLMYSDQSTKIKRKQWIGWLIYIEDYAKKKAFQIMWSELGYGYDIEFVNFMNKTINWIKTSNQEAEYKT